MRAPLPPNSRRRIQFLALFALVILATLISALRTLRGPHIDGRSLDAWVTAALAADPVAMEKAASVGPAAALSLSQILRTPEPLGSRLARRILPHWPKRWRSWLPEVVDPEMRRRRALDVLARMGTNALPSRPAVVEALRDSSAYVRTSAAALLGTFGVETPEATSALLRLAAETNEFVLVNVLPVLGRLKVDPASAVPLLGTKLSDPSSGVRLSAAVALGRYGPLARPATPELIRALGDSEAGLRGIVLQAFFHLENNQPEVVAALMAELDDPEPHNRIFALQALGRLGPAARPAVPHILTTMRNNVSSMWRHGRAALLRIAPEVPEAHQELHEQ